MTGYDLAVLPTHPYLGDRSAHIDGHHCTSRDEAEQIIRSMANGSHYEIRECTCPT